MSRHVVPAAYVALAEALGATLLTVDHRLADAPGLRCAIEVLGAALASRSVTAAGRRRPSLG